MPEDAIFRWGYNRSRLRVYVALWRFGGYPNRVSSPGLAGPVLSRAGTRRTPYVLPLSFPGCVGFMTLLMVTLYRAVATPTGVI
jgi:hypothetical protein